MMYLSSILCVYNLKSVDQTIGFKKDPDFLLDMFYKLPELSEGCILQSDLSYTTYAFKSTQRKRNYHEHVPKRQPADIPQSKRFIPLLSLKRSIITIAIVQLKNFSQ